MPCLPAKRIVSAWPLRLRWRLRSVVAPKLLFVLGIFLVADADMLGVEQPDDRGEHGVAAELAPLEVLLDPPPQPRQRLAELEQAFVFRALALGAEIGVVAILLAAARIDAGRLEMAVGVGAEPGLLIGRRQADGVQPVDLVAVGDALSLGVEIGPVAAHAACA